MAGKKKAEDDKYVTYERGRTGGTVRGPASGMVSGAHGTYKGEGGDAVTQKKVKPEIVRAAKSRLAGAKASGKANFPPKKTGGKKHPPFGVHGSRSTKEV